MSARVGCTGASATNTAGEHWAAVNGQTNTEDRKDTDNGRCICKDKPGFAASVAGNEEEWVGWGKEKQKQSAFE